MNSAEKPPFRASDSDHPEKDETVESSLQRIQQPTGSETHHSDAHGQQVLPFEESRDEARHALIHETTDAVKNTVESDSEVVSRLVALLSQMEGAGKTTRQEIEQFLDHLNQDTMEGHEEAWRFLKAKGLTGAQRWPGLHKQKGGSKEHHNFSEPSKKRVNRFAQLVASKVPLNKDSLILELGSGFGNDAAYFAQKTGTAVLGLDIAKEAVEEAREYIKKDRKLSHRVTLEAGDFLEQIKSMQGADLDMIYSHSTLHYTPRLVLERQILPRLAEMLRRKDGSAPGRLCMAMKTGGSASAKSAEQISLGKSGDAFNPKIHEMEQLFRNYPSSEAIVEVIEKNFDIEYIEVTEVSDYDRDGDVEEFVNIIATPKACEDLKAA